MAFQKHLCLLLSIFIVSISSSQANTFEIGGKDGWNLHPSESYANWAGRLRFLINDTLHFKYDGSSDSVLVVNRGDYDGCNGNNPITKLEGGDSLFKFDRSGPFYFITGNKSNCDQGQKLIVVVLALRNRSPPPPPSFVNPPSPSATPPSPSVSPVVPPSPAVSPVLPPSPAVSPVLPPSTVESPSAPPFPVSVSPSGTPVLTPPASSPGGGQSSGGNNPSADTTSPPPPSAAAPPFSGVIIASVVTIVYALWGIY